MTLDLSSLSNEKRAFLEANPELLSSLEKAIPLQAGRVQSRKEKLRKGKSKLQRDLHRVEDAKRKADELRRRYDPRLMEIERKVFGDAVVASKLVCPECGEGDHGNRMNKHPWCMKCNTALVPKNMLKKWRKLPTVKFARNALKNELHRLNPGLNPDNKEEL